MKKIIFSAIALSLLVVACNDNNAAVKDDAATTTTTVESKEERNKKVVMAAMDNFTKRNFDAMLEDAAPGFVDYADGSVPPITSKDTLRQFFVMVTTAIEDYKPQNLKYYADEDYVLVEADWTGTFKKDLMGIKATGKPVKFRDVDIFKLSDDGKVLEHSAIQNIGAALMTAGMQK